MAPVPALPYAIIAVAALDCLFTASTMMAADPTRAKKVKKLERITLPFSPEPMLSGIKFIPRRNLRRPHAAGCCGHEGLVFLGRTGRSQDSRGAEGGAIPHHGSDFQRIGAVRHENLAIGNA